MIRANIRGRAKHLATLLSSRRPVPSRQTELTVKSVRWQAGPRSIKLELAHTLLNFTR